MTEFIELLGNPAHWGFEFVSDSAFGLITYLAVRTPIHRWLDRGHLGPRHTPQHRKAP